jgi:hypothetical protein
MFGSGYPFGPRLPAAPQPPPSVCHCRYNGFSHHVPPCALAAAVGPAPVSAAPKALEALDECFSGAGGAPAPAKGPDPLRCTLIALYAATVAGQSLDQAAELATLLGYPIPKYTDSAPERFRAAVDEVKKLVTEVWKGELRK